MLTLNFANLITNSVEKLYIVFYFTTLINDIVYILGLIIKQHRQWASEPGLIKGLVRGSSDGSDERPFRALKLDKLCKTQENANNHK